MPSLQELSLAQANDETIDLLVSAGIEPLDLTGATIELILKPTPQTPDEDPAVTVLTSPDDITITNAAGGRCTARIPAAALASAGRHWWRLDVLRGGDRRTAMFGPAWVTDL
ncbi:hypothetical protein ACQEU3_46850 [Spirillospora sp. CA-253888]